MTYDPTWIKKPPILVPQAVTNNSIIAQKGSVRLDTLDWGQKVASTTLDSDQSGSQALTLTPLNNGKMFVAWGAGSVGRYNIIDSSGSFSGNQTFEAANFLDYSNGIASGLLPNGNVVLAYGQDQGAVNAIVFQIFDENGTQVRSAVTVKAHSSEDNWGVGVAILSDGNFVITWQEAAAGNMSYFAIYDSDGDVVKGYTSLGGNYTSPQPAPLSDGNWIVTYVSASAVRYRIFDRLGIQVGSETSFKSGVSQATGVTTMGNGQILIPFQRGFGIIDRQGNSVVAPATKDSTGTYSVSILPNDSIVTQNNVDAYAYYKVYNPDGTLRQSSTTYATEVNTITAGRVATFTNGNFILAYTIGTVNDLKFAIHQGTTATFDGNLDVNGSLTLESGSTVDTISNDSTASSATQLLTAAAIHNLNIASGVINSATNNKVARYDGTDNIQGSGIEIDDSDNISGVNDLRVGGDLFVDGTSWVVHNQEVTTSDNTIVINDGETGAGVTAGTAGIEVDRGSSTNYKFIFNETSDVFEIGEIGSLQAVATREDSPTSTRVPFWNDTNKRFDTAGNSSITVNTSTNVVTVTAASATQGTFDTNGLTLNSGASINEFSTDGTLTDDSDDAVPTEKATKTYIDTQIANLNPDKIWEDDSYIEVVDDGTNSGYVTIVTDGVEVAHFDSDASTQRLGKANSAGRVDVSDTTVSSNIGSDEVLNLSTSTQRIGLSTDSRVTLGTNTLDLYAGNTHIITGTTSGIQLVSGTTINEFSTDGNLTGNSDNAVPTEKAIKTYVDSHIINLNADKIWEDDSYIEVVDDGTNSGYVTIVTDSVEVAYFDADASTQRIGKVNDSRVALGANTLDLYAGTTHIITGTTSGIQLSSGATVNEFSTDENFTGNSDSAVPTEKAVKTYVDNGVGNKVHNSLLGLQGGDSTNSEYYHFTSTQYIDLTDSGDSALHYHSSDRARANHTGTQTASTISDFDTEVSNNTDVDANTTHRSSDGTDHGYINQDLQTTASPTFSGLTVNGDLFVDGTSWVVHNQEVTTSDNIIVVNDGEAGAGVTAGTAGIEVDRGSSTNYRFIFNETSDTFEIGEIGSLQAVATREDSPTSTRVPFWNDTDKKFDTIGTSSITIDTTADIITVAADSVIQGTFDTNGLTLSSGASVNEFSTDGTLSDDSNDTVPTEQAVKTYVDTQIANLNPDKIWEDDSYVEVIDDGTNSGYVTIVTDGVEVAHFDADASTQRIGKATSAGKIDISDTTVTSNIGSDEVLNLSASSQRIGLSADSRVSLGTNTLDLYAGTTHIITGTTSGIQLVSGTTINEFSTDGNLSGNSDNAVPTEKAVKSYVDAELDGKSHNALLGLQGGDSTNSEYYHLVEQVYSNLFDYSATGAGFGDSTGTNIIINTDSNETTAQVDQVAVLQLTETQQVFGRSGYSTITLDSNSIDMTVDDATNVLNVTTSGIALTNGTRIDEFSTDGNLSGNSNNAVPTEQAVKTYVDAELDGKAHNALLGLQGGDSTNSEYYHFTFTQHTDLTDAGDSALHYHSTDRARANHTGTQTASTISDFDTEVGNHTDVTANTTHRSSDGTDHGYINQDIQTTASPTFANLTINGDLFVDGTSWVVHNQEVTTSDNIIVVNDGEAGAGVTAGTAGIEVDRGSSTNYRFIFNETSDTFEIGEIGSLQAVATRENSPTDGGIAVWNNSAKRFDTSSDITASTDTITLTTDDTYIEIIDDGTNSGYVNIVTDGVNVAHFDADASTQRIGKASSAGKIDISDTAVVTTISTTEVLRATSNNVVINEGGSDVDFRVEGSGAVNALFVQGSDGYVGIGTGSPSSTLDIYKEDASIPAQLTIRSKDTALGSPPFSAIVLKASTTGDFSSTWNAGGIKAGYDGSAYDTSRLTLQSVNSSGTLIDTMSLKDGNVGIGTDTPGMELDVSGDTNLDGAVTINESGADKDFRVEGSGAANALFVQGSDGYVGINNATPGMELDVSGDTNLDGAVTINESGADKDFRVEGSGAANALFVQGSDGYVGVNTGTPRSELDIVGNSILDGTVTINDQLDIAGPARYRSPAGIPSDPFPGSFASLKYVNSRDTSDVPNGLLTHIDSDDQGDYAYGVWGDGRFIFLANYTGGLHTYSVDGSGILTHIDSDNPGDTAYGVWCDGRFIFIANGTGGLHTYSVDDSGILTHIDSDDQGDFAYGVWGDGRFIYLANHTGGLHTYSVDDSGNLTHIDSDDQGDQARGVWGDGRFIFLANWDGGLHTYSVDDSGNLTHIDSDDQGDKASGVWGDGRFIYLANNTGGLHTYSVDDSGILTHIDSDDQGDLAFGVWGDGRFVYLANHAGGLHTYSVDDSGNLTHIDSDDQGDSALAVWGDGRFVFLANDTGGLHTYSVDNAYEYDKATQTHRFDGTVTINDQLDIAGPARYRSPAGIPSDPFPGSFASIEYVNSRDTSDVSNGFLTHIDSDDQGDFAYGVWGDGRFIFLANHTGGLHTYSVDGSGNLTHIDSDDQGDIARAVWGDGRFVYLANRDGGLHTYSVDDSGNLTHIDSDDQGDAALGVWGDGRFIFLANDTGGLHTYSVDNSGNLTHIDSDDQGGAANSVWGDGSFIFLANGAGGLHTYSVDDSGNLTHIDSDNQGDNAYGVWGDGSFIFLANDTGGLHTYSVDDSGNLTHIDSDDQGDNANSVWGDGSFIFLANDAGGLHTYLVDNSGNLTHIDFDDQGDFARGVWGDGRFVFLANSSGGLHTYSVDNAYEYDKATQLHYFTGPVVSDHDDITATSEGVAASIATDTTFVTTNGDTDLDNVTLADGTEGQIKHICCVVEGNAADTWKITPANMVGGTQITFAGIGLGCTLKMYSAGWVVISNNGGVIS